MLGATREEFMESSWLVFFSIGVIYSLEELHRGIPSFITHIWHMAKLPPSLTAQSMEETALFYGGSVRRVHGAHQEECF